MDSPIIQLLLLLSVSWFLGRFFARRLDLPPMLGELVAGLIFGPSILGIIHPSEYITFLAELGVFFLMFYAGTETDPKMFFRSIKSSILVGIGGFLIPFISGYLFSKWIFPEAGEFQAIFIGLGMSTTAIAVNARIIMDMDIKGNNIANILIGGALVDDILALGVFSAVVEAVNEDKIGQTISLHTLIYSTSYVLLFFLITYAIGKLVLPLLNHLYIEEGYGFTFSLVTALVFAYIAELMGLHLVIGAFLAGLFVREELKEGTILDRLNDRLNIIAYGFLGPIFFVSLSFHVEIMALVREAWFLLLIVAIAIFGKFIGAYCALMLTRMSHPDRTIISVGMNGRGAVELILVSVGVSLGILSSQIASLLISLAFITTLLTPLCFKMLLRFYQAKGLYK